MTEFRSKGKGKERKVFPVKKRQPYGISRELAYMDVKQLREQGKRARLIKTNQRLDLYAPYMPYETQVNTATMAVPQEVKNSEEVSPKVKPANTETENKSSSQGKVTFGTKVDIKEALGITNKNGKLNLNSRDMDSFYSKDSTMRISIKNGKLELMSVDPARVAMIQETVDTTLPDGYLEPVAFGKDFSTEWMPEQPKNSLKVHWPTPSYVDNTFTVRIEGRELETFLGNLNKNDEEVTTFGMIGTSSEAAKVMLYRTLDRGSYEQKREIVQTLNAVSNDPRSSKQLPAMIGRTPDRVSMNTEYLRSTIRTILGRKAYQHPDKEVLTLTLKDSYPLEMATRRISPQGESVIAKGILAPRME